ncbi:MAG: cyclic nucleotide-binding domain-containing protein [Myxococcales bacterium]|nr:cyclic nucleotide-binding domain-containing protein [Myxococcales bacterium]
MPHGLDELDALTCPLEAGEVVCQQGEKPTHLAILLWGRLGVYRDGHRVGEIAEPGAYIGESAILDDRAFTASVEAEATSAVVRVPADRARRVLAAPEAEAKALRALASRLGGANQRLVDLNEQLAAQRAALGEALGALATLYASAHDEADPDTLRMHVMNTARALVRRYGRGDMTDEPIRV